MTLDRSFAQATCFALLSLLSLLSLAPALEAAAQPLVLPGARIPGGTDVPPSGFPLDPRQPDVSAPPQPPALRPVAGKNPAEDTILTRELKLGGVTGSLRVERAGKSELRARMILAGTRLSSPGESCSIAAEVPVPITARGRPDGLLRYEIEAPSCPMSAELLDGALWVKGGGACVVEAADCRVDPRGLWGPDPAQLATQARVIENDRGQADKAVRENYKVLTARARPQEVRAIVSEQAAFSSEREMLCRSYAREPAHGFCNARFTEARVAQLAARLGLAAATPGSVSPRRAKPPTPLVAAPQ
jgi:hypothetical protein